MQYLKTYRVSNKIMCTRHCIIITHLSLQFSKDLEWTTQSSHLKRQHIKCF